MSWIQLRVNATKTSAETVGDLMTECGAVSVTFLDAKDNPIFEPLPGETRLWGETDVMGLWTADADIDVAIAYLKANGVLDQDRHYKAEILEDKDWVRAWIDDFKPMQFGKRLWICPSWCDIPEPDAVNVMLDPGLAFGTGTHATTALCLRWLDGLELEGKTVIDYGCGSGILAIAALKLGAAKVIGVDIDPQALVASRDNAQRNGVADRLEVYLPEDRPTDIQADVLVANILSGPLKELAADMASLVRPNGLLALSGLLETQIADLTPVYSQWFDMESPAVETEWARLSGLKRGEG